MRVVAATNVDLTQPHRGRQFREDLYYRLNVVPISLAARCASGAKTSRSGFHFLKKYAARSNSRVTKISNEGDAPVAGQPWKGNVRELENAIEHAIVFCKDDTLQPGDLPFARGRNGGYHEAETSAPVLIAGGARPAVPRRQDQALPPSSTLFFGAFAANGRQRLGGGA